MFRRFPNPDPPAPEPLLPERGWQVPAVGWRTWRVRRADGGPLLEGVYSGVRWEPGTTHAGCRRCPPWMAHLHPVPVPSCECGLYAFSRPDDAFRCLLSPADLPDGDESTALVAGAVIAWGRTVQHGRQGWRAQHARPIALLDSDHPLLPALALRHRVPVVSARGLRLLPLEHGEVLAG